MHRNHCSVSVGGREGLISKGGLSLEELKARTVLVTSTSCVTVQSSSECKCGD